MWINTLEQWFSKWLNMTERPPCETFDLNISAYFQNVLTSENTAENYQLHILFSWTMHGICHLLLRAKDVAVAAKRMFLHKIRLGSAHATFFNKIRSLMQLSFGSLLLANNVLQIAGKNE